MGSEGKRRNRGGTRVPVKSVEMAPSEAGGDTATALLLNSVMPERG
jgi:hypothetical protein